MAIGSGGRAAHAASKNPITATLKVRVVGRHVHADGPVATGPLPAQQTVALVPKHRLRQQTTTTVTGTVVAPIGKATSGEVKRPRKVVQATVRHVALVVGAVPPAMTVPRPLPRVGPNAHVATHLAKAALVPSAHVPKEAIGPVVRPVMNGRLPRPMVAVAALDVALGDAASVRPRPAEQGAVGVASPVGNAEAPTRDVAGDVRPSTATSVLPHAPAPGGAPGLVAGLLPALVAMGLVPTVVTSVLVPVRLLPAVPARLEGVPLGEVVMAMRGRVPIQRARYVGVRALAPGRAPSTLEVDVAVAAASRLAVALPARVARGPAAAAHVALTSNVAVPAARVQVGGPGAVQAAARKGPMALLAAHGVPTTGRPVVVLTIPPIPEGPSVL